MYCPVIVKSALFLVLYAASISASLRKFFWLPLIKLSVKWKRCTSCCAYCSITSCAMFSALRVLYLGHRKGMSQNEHLRTHPLLPTNGRVSISSLRYHALPYPCHTSILFVDILFLRCLFDLYKSKL